MQSPLSTQRSDSQSASLAQRSPASHGEHEPPQSTSDSSPFWRPSMQLAAVGMDVGAGTGALLGSGSGNTVGDGYGAAVGWGVGNADVVGARVGIDDGSAVGVCVLTDTLVTESDARDVMPADAAADAMDDASAPEETAALTESLISRANEPLSSDATVWAIAVIDMASAVPLLSLRTVGECWRPALLSTLFPAFSTVSRREVSAH